MACARHLANAAVRSMLGGSDGGMISLTGTKAVSLTNGTVLFADGVHDDGGTILINSGGLFTSQQSTISARRVVTSAARSRWKPQG